MRNDINMTDRNVNKKGVFQKVSKSKSLTLENVLDNPKMLEQEFDSIVGEYKGVYSLTDDSISGLLEWEEKADEVLMQMNAAQLLAIYKHYKPSASEDLEIEFSSKAYCAENKGDIILNEITTVATAKSVNPDIHKYVEFYGIMSEVSLPVCIVHLMGGYGTYPGNIEQALEKAISNEKKNTLNPKKPQLK